MAELKDVYTVKELAELLNVLPQSIRRLIYKGSIKASKFNGGYIITKEEAQRLLDEKGAAV